MTRILIPKETGSDEARVAATPETVQKLTGRGLAVAVEQGAGEASWFADDDYTGAGAEIAPPGAGWDAEIVCKVGPLTAEETRRLGSGSVVVGLLDPYSHPDTVRALAAAGVTALPMEFIPRITRAQSMDALSSQASVAGYKAVLVAAARLGRYLPLLMTAAGTIRPAKVVVMGAGVAGLQAVATAKRLGAVVEVSDIRPEVKEQVASLGARFIDLPEMESGSGEGGYAKEMGEEFLRRQREILTQRVAAADVVVTTAQVPGKRAPRLLTREMVEAMHAGSVIVDLAAPQGGNCELTRAGEEVVHGGVIVLGPRNLPATVSHDASSLYARNVLELLGELLDDGGRPVVDREGEVVGAMLLTHEGQVVHPGVAAALAQKEG
ncbi:MAG: Re/Si-specific NAD(P)(+) transhydrogenase subunit alpha [Thermoanaerobaculia bacterium]|nr:Re/Si-specific NAD(P)(+) transhydrogenase subunit alpha [Thermoanaerobaculia bacterium]